MAPLLLGVDVGTTHCKAGLFDPNGTARHVATRPMPLRHTADGRAEYDPARVWDEVENVIREVVTAGAGARPEAVGISSMAETGLLVDRQTGAPRTAFLPWHDTAAAAQADRLARCGDPRDQFARSGLRVSFKVGLAKLLWLRERGVSITEGAVWLSVADFVAYRLTGVMATDPTLAARTFAFDIRHREWDEAWLAELGFTPALFPRVQSDGIIGETRANALAGLPAGVPVVIAGHDHLVAAWAAGALGSGRALDSMGTAESLIGALPDRALGQGEFASGLTFAPAPGPNSPGLIWLGGLSTSGGAVEWLRTALLAASPEAPRTYDEVAALLAAAGTAPADLLFLPYLAGSQAPRHDPAARAAFIGLRLGHTQTDIAKAVVQGAAYELEAIRRAAEGLTGKHIEQITAVGGGTRLAAWLQIKADVMGVPVTVLPQTEATLLGAAALAGLAAGVYTDATTALAAIARPPAAVYAPQEEHHARHRRLLEVYLALQEPAAAAAHVLGRRTTEKTEHTEDDK